MKTRETKGWRKEWPARGIAKMSRESFFPLATRQKFSFRNIKSLPLLFLRHFYNSTSLFIIVFCSAAHWSCIAGILFTNTAQSHDQIVQIIFKSNRAVRIIITIAAIVRINSTSDEIMRIVFTSGRIVRIMITSKIVRFFYYEWQIK